MERLSEYDMSCGYGGELAPDDGTGAIVVVRALAAPCEHAEAVAG